MSPFSVNEHASVWQDSRKIILTIVESGKLSSDYYNDVTLWCLNVSKCGVCRLKIDNKSCSGSRTTHTLQAHTGFHCLLHPPTLNSAPSTEGWGGGTSGSCCSLLQGMWWRLELPLLLRCCYFQPFWLINICKWLKNISTLIWEYKRWWGRWRFVLSHHTTVLLDKHLL